MMVVRGLRMHMHMRMRLQDGKQPGLGELLADHQEQHLQAKHQAEHQEASTTLTTSSKKCW